MKHILYVTLLLFPLFVGCRDNSKIDQQLATAGRLSVSAPDSAIIILDKVTDELSGKMDVRKAQATMLLAKIRQSQGKSFLKVENFDEALDFYEAAHDSTALLDMYRLAALRMLCKNEPDSAMLYLRKAIVVSSDTTVPSKSNLYIELSNLYALPSLDKNYTEAINYAKQALMTARTSGERARANHDIGLFHSFNNKEDSAVIYMEKALTEIGPDDELYSTLVLNYANSPEADLGKSITYLNSIKGKHLGKLLTLGFLYLNKVRLDSAKNYLIASKALFNEHPSIYSINTYNSLRLLDQSLNLINTGTVKQYDGTVTNDSITELTNLQRIISEERLEHSNRLQIRLLQQKSYHQWLWNIGLSFVLILTLGFGVYVWYSKRRYMSLKQRLDNVKIEQIVSEASDDGSEAESSLGLIRRRMEICIEQFRTSKLQSEIDRIEMTYRTTGNYPPIRKRELIQKKLIGCFADFIVDLKMTGVKLNIEDIITCIMSCLRESNATIAACLGVTDSAIRTRKSRLRTKLPAEILNLIDL